MTLVRISTTLGAFDLELDDEHAPATVANFLAYVDDRSYDGGSFHRVVTPQTSGHDEMIAAGYDAAVAASDGSIPISVVQAGPREGTREDPPITLEPTSRTGIRHVRGTISMGRTAPDSATTAFFVCLADQPELDEGGARTVDRRGFAAFGRVVAGMSVVEDLYGAPRRAQRLNPPIEIENIIRL